MRMLQRLAVLAAPAVEYSADVKRDMQIAAFSRARDLCEADANAERLAAWLGRYAQFRSGDFIAVAVPAPSVSRVLAAQAGYELEQSELPDFEAACREIAQQVQALNPEMPVTFRLIKGKAQG